MTDQKNTVKIFVVAGSEPARRKLLHLFHDIPTIEVVGTAGEKFIAPEQLNALEPDLLLLDLDAREKASRKLSGYISQHLPRCKAIVLGKSSECKPGRPPAFRPPGHGRGKRASALVDPDDPLIRPDGTVDYSYDHIEYIASASRGTTHSSAVRDIVEHKQAQEELERSHGELQELIAMFDSLRLEEQKRLAHEMHDEFGQLLAAMKIDLSALQQHLPQQNSEVAGHLCSINELVDTMMTSVRRILADLPPKIIEDLGLFSALQSMASAFETRHHVACTLRAKGHGPGPDTRVATAIYRMVQEALNNVAKHARASLVEIEVRSDGEQVCVRVADNGIGIPAKCMRRPGSFGLVGMRERAAALGGDLRVSGRAGHGTSLEITIPLGRFASPACRSPSTVRR